MKILVVGESCLDIFDYGECNRLCPEAPVPIFNSIERLTGGGMARNVYNNISSMNIETVLHTNTNWEQITKTRFIDHRTNHMFMRLDCNDDKYEKCNIKDIKYEEYDAIVVSDYNKGFLSEQDIRAISLNHDCVFLDTKKRLGDWCEGVTFIKINEHEFQRNREYIVGNIDNKIITTLGRRGATYASVEYPVPEVEIRDVAGAGDSFIAGLIVNYVETRDIESAIVFANKCATEAVQKRGVSTP
jgi:D-beta-D-heptose 7-phosphate kinase/D-beta-D-heptose 1-phosphate adenosyltransferase